MKRLFPVFFLLIFVLISSTLIAQKAEEYLTSGDEKSTLKDFAGAIEDYNKVINMIPHGADSVYIKRNQKSNLKDYLNLVHAYYNRGVARSSLKDFYAAIEDYDKTISLNSSHANAYFNRAQARFNVGDYRDALEDFDKHLVLNKENRIAYYSRGITLIKLGEAEAGCMDLRKAADAGYLNALDVIKEYCK